MTRNEILIEIKQYFDIDELVCNHTFKKWGRKRMAVSRYRLPPLPAHHPARYSQKPMFCNNHSVGTYQRGMRCNMCPMVKGKTEVYLSSHILGKAGDFTIQGMTAEQARQSIKNNAGLLPCNIRVEGGVTWLHFDVLPQTGITQKVYEFKA